MFPKGHIEDGESPEETAVREVREEAGVEARPIRDVGMVTFTSPRGEAVRARYFLMEYVAAVPALEDREIRWCSTAEALELVPFETTHALIRRVMEPD